MKAPIIEVFSSIQGEGTLIGKRQIFIRFAGCNLNCNYCDTQESRNLNIGTKTSIEELTDKVNKIITPDFHSLSFTGGEPLLHADFIQKFQKENKFPSLLETNGTLPQELKKIADLVDYASIDIKLPEHFSEDLDANIIQQEIESTNILISKGVKIYCKVVILPSTQLDTIRNLAKMIKEEVTDSSKISLILQPASPIENWAEHTQKLFKMSENMGKYLDVRVIPQMHKILNIQ